MIKKIFWKTNSNHSEPRILLPPETNGKSRVYLRFSGAIFQIKSSLFCSEDMIPGESKPSAAFAVQKIWFQASQLGTCRVDARSKGQALFLMTHEASSGRVNFMVRVWLPRRPPRKAASLKPTPSPLSKSLFATQNRATKIKARLERKSLPRRFSEARAFLYKLTSSRVIL